PLHFDGDRKGFLVARSRRGHATGLMDHLVDIEVAIWAVRNHRLARLERELSAIEIESGPCCQDSPMLSTMGLMIEPARHPPASRTHIRRQGSATRWSPSARLSRSPAPDTRQWNTL